MAEGRLACILRGFSHFEKANRLLVKRIESKARAPSTAPTPRAKPKNARKMFMKLEFFANAIYKGAPACYNELNIFAGVFPRGIFYRLLGIREKGSLSVFTRRILTYDGIFL